MTGCKLARATEHGERHCLKMWPTLRTVIPMSNLLSMTTRRVKRVLAWVLAFVVLVLMGAGVVYVVTEVL